MVRKARIKVGDRVRVPFGVGDVEGIVLRVSETSRQTRVMIELVGIAGLDEPYVSSWDGDSVELVDAA